MENANIVALNKVINDKSAAMIAARNGLTVGVHEVDFTVRIAGTLHVGNDYDTAPTVSFSVLETLALTLHYCGVTREAAKGMLTRVLRESIDKSGKGAGALSAALPWVSQMVDEIKDEIIGEMTKQPRKGAVRANLEFTEAEQYATM